ncbi:hypothetical protein L1049_018012 [Liquidambar formosana]|uniref:Reverse transcriptase n=1 Tax=Liquidambar formosana TaxID=63359 RepID=A0AAP0NI01_LIQFO
MPVEMYSFIHKAYKLIADASNCPTIKLVLDNFCQSGQLVNSLKSKVFFSKRVPTSTYATLSDLLDIPTTPNPGRVTLIKSVMSSLPYYYMQCVALLESTCKQLDRLNKDFLWGSTMNKRKIHLLNWNTVTKSIKMGGLGIKKSSTTNEALLAKLNWCLLKDKDQLWAHIFRAKYMSRNARLDSRRYNSSHIFKSVFKG